MIVKDIMHPATIIEPELTVAEAATLMKKKEIGSLMVKKGEKDWAIVTERDMLNKVVAENIQPADINVQDIMTDLRLTIDANSPLEDASEIFNSGHVRRLPVMEKGEIVGIITSRDVAKRWIFTRFRRRVEYSRGSGGNIR